MEQRKYYVKSSWIFNLESMTDKIHCLEYDIQDGVLDFPFEVAGRHINDYGDIYKLLDEVQQLEWIAKR